MKYYLNANSQPNHNEHELHKETCSRLPDLNNRIFIGNYQTDAEALRNAKVKYSGWIIDGCYYCCPSIHRL